MNAECGHLVLNDCQSTAQFCDVVNHVLTMFFNQWCVNVSVCLTLPC